MATGIEPRQLGRLIPIWNRTIPIKPIRIATRGDLSITELSQVKIHKRDLT